MTVPTIKVYPHGTRESEVLMPLDELTKSIFEDMKSQVAELLIEQDGSASPKDEFVQKYMDARNYLVDRIAKRMANSMSTELFNQVFNDATRVVESAENLWDKRSAGGVFGNFIEGNVFGLPENKLAIPDLWDENTEIKGSLSTGQISVGGTTIYNITETDAEDTDKMNLILLQKMAVKMANLLLFKLTYDKTQSRHRVNLHFGEITLYTVLFLQKLWDEINKIDRVVTIVPKGTWNRADMSRSYDVEIKYTKTKSGAYEFAKLYLRNYDLKAMMKTDSRFRKAFWAEANKGKIKATPMKGMW